jgi:hypothetical protein
VRVVGRHGFRAGREELEPELVGSPAVRDDQSLRLDAPFLGVRQRLAQEPISPLVEFLDPIRRSGPGLLDDPPRLGTGGAGLVWTG